MPTPSSVVTRGALDVDERRQAGAARLAVDQHGAGAAAALLAAGLGGREPELLAQDLQQGRQRLARRWPARRRSRPASWRAPFVRRGSRRRERRGWAGCGRGTSRTRARRRAAARRRAPPAASPPPRARVLGGGQADGVRAGAGDRDAQVVEAAGAGGRPRPRGWCRCGRAAGRAARSRCGRRSANSIESTRRSAGEPARKSSTASVRSPPAPAERTCAPSAISGACRSPRGASLPSPGAEVAADRGRVADLAVGDAARGAGQRLRAVQPGRPRGSSRR